LREEGGKRGMEITKEMGLQSDDSERRCWEKESAEIGSA